MKTLMVSFTSKWARMILSGEKKYEFRQGNFVNVKTGDKFLILESLGKKTQKRVWYQHQYTEEDESIIFFKENDKSIYDILINTWVNKKRTDFFHEGTGKVIGEFIVGRIYKDILTDDLDDEDSHELMVMATRTSDDKKVWLDITSQDLAKQGFDTQPLAFEITDLVVYDTPRDKSEYVVAGKWEAFCKCMTEENQTETYYSYVYGKNGYVVRSPQSFMYVIDTV
jgi:hypothetical protein